MDPSSYKDVTTSNGFNYHYFVSAPVGAKPTLLFVHGFPSTSYDWRHQVAFFRKEGYGLIVPDTLGYGGSDKPTDVAFYKKSMLATNLIDILNAEKVDKVIAIGHDWGAGQVSQLALSHSDRFLAFGFLAVGFMPPNPTFEMQKVLEYMKQTVGYEVFGYWLFFSEEGADKVMEKHIDSFISLLYPHDPKTWIANLAPTGTAKAYISADKIEPLPSYLTEADKDEMKKSILSGGLTAPLNYYTASVRGLNAEEDKKIPAENYVVGKPVFFGGALQDYVCLNALQKASVDKFCKNATIKEFDTDHWVQLAAPEQVNKELLSWIKGIKT